MRATLFFGKVVRLTDWAVRLPSPPLGCLNVSPSFRLSVLSSLQLPHGHFTLLQQGEGYLFLHLPYLATCTAGPNAWIKSTHCSVTSVCDGSVVSLLFLDQNT